VTWQTTPRSRAFVKFRDRPPMFMALDSPKPLSYSGSGTGE
jgi:hypothetical protein